MRLPMSIVALLCVAPMSWPEMVLQKAGRLTDESRQLKGGEYIAPYTLEAAAGDLVTVTVTSSDFPAYVLANAPSDRGYGGPVADFDGPLQFIVRKDGEVTVAVTTVEAGQSGAFSLTVDVTPVEGGLAGLDHVIKEAGSLSDEDTKLDSGKYADIHALDAEAGDVVRIVVRSTEFDAVILAGSPARREFDSDDVHGTNPEVTFVAEKAGSVGVIVTSSTPGETGAYEVRGSLGKLAGGSKPGGGGEGEVKPTPAVERAVPEDPRNPTKRLTLPTPNPATVANPGVLKDTLQRMSQVVVSVAGSQNVYRYMLHIGPDAPEGIGEDRSGIFPGDVGIHAGAEEAGEPGLSWSGNVFTFAKPFYERERQDEGEDDEVLIETEGFTEVVGTVSPSGERLDKVRIMGTRGTFVTYTNDVKLAGKAPVKSGVRHYKQGVYMAITLVDLPLVESRPGTAETNWDRVWRPVSMERLIGIEGEGDPRSISSFGYLVDGPDTRDHVVKVEYKEDTPALPYGTYIWTVESHTTTRLKGMEWLNADHPPEVSVVFSNP